MAFNTTKNFQEKKQWKFWPLLSLSIIMCGLGAGFLLLSFLSSIYAHQHLNHHAHIHNEAMLSIVFNDKTSGVVRLESPAINIYGFEHQARSTQDKKALDTAVETLQKRISEIVRLDPTKACILKPSKIDAFVADRDDDEDDDSLNSEEDTDLAMKPKTQKGKTKVAHAKHGEHGDFHADFRWNCQQSLHGTVAQISFLPYFKNFEKMWVQVISDEKSEKKLLRGARGEVQL